MPTSYRLTSLQSRKQELESQIQDEIAHPAYNVFRVMELKKRKLMIMDQIKNAANTS